MKKKVFVAILMAMMLTGCGSKVNVCNYKNIDLSQNKDGLPQTEYVMQYLLDETKYDNYSKEDVNNYLKECKSFYEDYAKELGVDYDTYIKEYLKTSNDEFDKQMKEAAVNYVKEKDILLQIAKDENIELSDEDYEKYLESLVEKTGYNTVDDLKKEIKKNNEEDNIREAALLEKVAQYVVDLNKK